MSVVKRQPFESIFNRWLKDVKNPAVYGAIQDTLNFLRQAEDNIVSILNQGIKIADNVDGSILEFTTNAIANTQDTTAHGLVRVPNYFIVLDINLGGVLYRSASFDDTNFYSKCTVAAAAVKVLVI